MPNFDISFIFIIGNYVIVIKKNEHVWWTWYNCFHTRSRYECVVPETVKSFRAYNEDTLVYIKCVLKWTWTLKCRLFAIGIRYKHI